MRWAILSALLVVAAGCNSGHRAEGHRTVISETGRIGPLRMNRSTRADVISSAGRPDAERRGVEYDSTPYLQNRTGKSFTDPDVTGTHVLDMADPAHPRKTAELTNAIQKFFLENSRLGIPVMFHEECLHGHAASLRPDIGRDRPGPFLLRSVHRPG